MAAHLQAYCWKYGFQLANLAFGEYSRYFPNFPKVSASAEGRLRLKRLLPWSRRVSNKSGRRWDFDNDEIPALAVPLQKGEDVFYEGWLFRGNQTLAQYRTQMIHMFAPSPESETSVGQQWALTKTQSVKIGVHVRWEDYRGTEFFFPLEQFIFRMKEAERLFPGKKVQFLIFSSEDVQTESFNGMDVVHFHGTPVVDLYTMARCDYLVGPPSTFSAWASWYGQVPLFTMGPGLAIESLDSFVVNAG